MELTLIEQFFDNLNQIEQFIDQEEFDMMSEMILLNNEVLEGLHKLKVELPENQWQELSDIKRKLIKRQSEVLSKLETVTLKKRPQLQEMSQKVQASQIYNKMKRGY